MELTTEHGLEYIASSEASTDPAQPYVQYGKACLSCVKSKTKCSNPVNGGKCERCHRLKRICQPAPTIRKKRVSKRRATSASAAANKTAALEDKLDGMVQLLQRFEGQVQPAWSSPVHSTSHLQNPNLDKVVNYTNQTLVPNGVAILSSAARDGTNLDSIHPSPMPAASTSLESTLECCRNTYTSSSYPLEVDDELDEYLETYRSKMVTGFPIVCIGPEVTVKNMREERPLLWLVIRAICSKNSARQTVLGIEVRKTLGREMLLEGAKNLDLLLGVLVFAAWGHYYGYHKSIITTVIMLAKSLAFDLGLTRPIPAEPLNIMLNYGASGCPRPGPDAVSSVRTMEERRAAIGLFLIHSVNIIYSQRINEPTRWTLYLKECLQLLEEQKDYPTDALLVCMVQVQLIANSVAVVSRKDTYDDLWPKAPLNIYLEALKLQLDEFKRVIPPELESNIILHLQILNTYVSIHEHSLYTPISKTISPDPAAQMQRIENLWACLLNIKSWFTTFFSLEPASYPQAPMAIFTQMSHCLVALFRLSTFESPDVFWDRQRVRQELDLSEVLKLWAERWEGVPAAAGLDTDITSAKEEDPWSYTRKKILAIRRWWDAKIAATNAAEMEKDRGPGVESDGAMNGFGMPSGDHMEGTDFAAMTMDFMDDSWMKEWLEGAYDLSGVPNT